MAKTKAHPELVFQKKNKNLLKLPKHARIEKRPIPHPPSASPYASQKVPKVVYVSTKTPFMSAAKRVQKLLREAEKRATRKVNLGDSSRRDKDKLAQLKETSDALQKEEVFIKATGRAIDKAMSVGKWFEEKDGYNTKVKTGTVLVVDDIVEDEEKKEKLKEKAESEQALDGSKAVDKSEDTHIPDAIQPIDLPKTKNKKRKSVNNNGDTNLPDSRTRWINMVEIAVTLK